MLIDNPKNVLLNKNECKKKRTNKNVLNSIDIIILELIHHISNNYYQFATILLSNIDKYKS